MLYQGGKRIKSNKGKFLSFLVHNRRNWALARDLQGGQEIQILVQGLFTGCSVRRRDIRIGLARASSG